MSPTRSGERRSTFKIMSRALSKRPACAVPQNVLTCKYRPRLNRSRLRCRGWRLGRRVRCRKSHLVPLAVGKRWKKTHTSPI